jgi:hypothetical protein
MKLPSLPAVTSALPHEPIRTTATSGPCARSFRRPDRSASLGGSLACLEDMGETAAGFFGKLFERAYATGLHDLRSSRGWSLEDPGHIQAALQDRAKENLILGESDFGVRASGRRHARTKSGTRSLGNA